MLEKYRVSSIESGVQDDAFAFRAFSRLARRDFLRAAVLLCIVLVLDTLSSRLATSRNCSPAVCKSPAASAFSKCFICVLTLLLRARLIALLFKFCLILFFADNECATSNS
jgi:hypothetical protein